MQADNINQKIAKLCGKGILEAINKKRAIAAAKRKFKVYPSAYANAWASKWYKSKGGSWR